jgi:hypothetical protein
LENLADRALFEVEDYTALLNEFENRGLDTNERLYIAIDEMQLLPNLPSVVKYLYDHHPIKFFLTGSSSFYIKNHFSESMAGRKVVYELLPLRFQEFLDFHGVLAELPDELELERAFPRRLFQQLQTYYEEYIQFGGLPRVVLTEDRERKRRLLQELFSSYINIDVQTLADFKSTTDLRRVIQLLAARVGNKVNVSEIGKIVGLSRITVQNYIEFLEQTYLIRTLPAYSSSADVRSRLQRKVYFVDTGIATVNADLSGGAKFENTTVHQLSQYGELSYADVQGEIDVALRERLSADGEDARERVVALEMKETPTASDLRTLQRRAQAIDADECRIMGRDQSASFEEYLWGGMVR